MENCVIIPDFVIADYCVIIACAGLLEERNYKVGLWLKEDALRKLGFPIVILRPEDLTDFHVSLTKNSASILMWDLRLNCWNRQRKKFPRESSCAGQS